jgi:SulP family sulfate permease
MARVILAALFPEDSMIHQDHTPRVTFRSQLREELRPNRLVPGLAAGVVSATLIITVAVAFATLIFAGDLSGYVSNGIGFLLFSAVVFGALTALVSSFQAVIANPQDSPAAIMALVAVSVTDRMNAEPDKMFVTVVAALMLTAFATGIVFLLLGFFKRGNLVRYIPYPVIGGFLAGTGLLLVQGAISVMADVPVNPSHLDAFTTADYILKWLPGLVFAALLLALLRRYSHFLLVPGMLITAIVAFYLVLLVSGTSISEAKDEGWLLDSFPESGGGLWEPPSPSDWDDVDWSALGAGIGNLAAVTVVSAIALLLNATGLELATEQDADLNRELKAAGLSNLVAGLGGGLVGYHGLGPSALSYRMGGRGRLPGLFLALLCAAAMFVGGALLAYFPKPVLGGLLLLLGLDFLVTWVYDAWFKLPRADYLIVLLILVVINLVGFLEGIGLGIVVAGVLFVVSYSRIDVVKHTLSGVNFHSNVVRPSFHEQLLGEQGDWTCIFKLQGFLFFGTANRLLEQVRARLHEPARPAPHYVVLDFRLVSGLDSSAALSFAKMRQFAQAHGLILCFSQLTPSIQAQLAREVFRGDDDPICRTFPDLDHAVEWCENDILHTLQDTGIALELRTLQERLEDALNNPDYAGILMQYLECQEVEQGYVLIRQGDPPRGLFFVESGQVTVQLERDDAPPLRLRKMSAGTIVGEMGMYLNRPASASVIADQPGTLYFLSPDALKRLEQEHPEAASAFHGFMACFLAERLTQTTNTLQALAD